MLVQDFMHDISYLCYEYDIDLRNQSSAFCVFCVSQYQYKELPPSVGYLWLSKLHILNSQFYMNISTDSLVPLRLWRTDMI